MRKRTGRITGLNRAPSGAPKLALTGAESAVRAYVAAETASEQRTRPPYAIHHEAEVEGYRLITLSADTRALVGV